MTSWKNRSLLGVLLLSFLTIPAQGGLFGIHFADRQEYVKARQTYESGNYAQAITELSQYIYKTKNIKRREARAYRLLGLSYEHLGQPEKALEIYLEALEFHQKDIPLLLTAADLYQRTQLTDRSIELYDRVLKLDPDNQQALSGQAENYSQMGFYSKSRSYYDRFFELNPTAPAVHRARYAYTFLQQRDYKNAFTNITMAKMEDPYEPTYWLLSARAYRGLQHAQDSLADLDMAIWLDPQRTEWQNLKSMWLYQQEDFEASLQLARQLLKENPQDELALFMVYLNLRKTRPAQARKALQQIQRLDNNSFANRLADKLLEK